MKQIPFTEEYISYLKPYHIEDIQREYLSLHTYKRGEFIFLEGEVLHALFIVVKGRSKVVFSLENGKTLLVAFYTNTGMLGDIEFVLGNIPACNSVQALTDVTCIQIKLPLAKDYLFTQNAFLQEITKGLASKLKQSNHNDALLILSPLEDRLCSYLYMVNEHDYFQERLTETAELLGTSYRHLLRTLERLCHMQILERVSGGYHILDMHYVKDHGKHCYHLDKEGSYAD